MNRKEKALYHQIHPAKLAVDWACGIFSLIPMWDHRLILSLIIAFVPSFLISYLLIRLADLSRYKHSAFGRYMAAHMSPWLQFVRMFGFVLMLTGAWHHDLLIIAFGLALILLAWLHGVFTNAIRKHTVPHSNH